MDKIKWKLNTLPKVDDNEKQKGIEFLRDKEISKVKGFHESIPQYERTPLVKLENLAKMLGVEGVYLKDESYRFGLNAFKVLGGSFAMAKYMADKLGKEYI